MATKSILGEPGTFNRLPTTELAAWAGISPDLPSYLNIFFNNINNLNHKLWFGPSLAQFGAIDCLSTNT